jgi:hypothetical protein
MNPYYVYALKDPRSNPARPFYIGKGTGSRAWDHSLRADDTRKGKRIAEIQSAGRDVVTTVLADDLTEIQALKLESELVAAFGTLDTGGMLTNTVVPSGRPVRLRSDLIVPAGVVERAQVGLDLLKEAILELAQANAAGISNAEASKALGLQSDYGGGSKDYLAFSVLGILMRDGKLVRAGGQRKHKAVVR